METLCILFYIMDDKMTFERMRLFLLLFIIWTVCAESNNTINELKTCRKSNVVLLDQTNSDNVTSSVSWSKDGKTIDTFDSKFEVSNERLIVEDIEVDDAGQYMAEINGEITIQFNVAVPDTRFIVRVKNTSFEKNDRATFKALSMNHGGSWMWHFQNKQLLNSSLSNHFKFPDPLHYGIENGSVLEIHRIQHRHAGNYKVTFDVEGCQESHIFSVEVKNSKDDKFGDPLLAYLLLSSKRMYSQMKNGKMFVFVIIVAVLVVLMIGVFLIACCLDFDKKIKKFLEKRKKKKDPRQSLNDQANGVEITITTSKTNLLVSDEGEE